MSSPRIGFDYGDDDLIRRGTFGHRISPLSYGLSGLKGIALNNLFKNLAIWLVIGVVLMTVFNQFSNRQAAQNSVEYSPVHGGRQAGNQDFQGDRRWPYRAAQTQDGRQITVHHAGVQDIWMVGDLMRYGVQGDGCQARGRAVLPDEHLRVVVPHDPAHRRVGFLHASDAGGGRGGAFSFGKSKAKMLDETANTVTFADVAGCDEAKEEVGELVEFLRILPSSRSSAAAFPRAC